MKIKRFMCGIVPGQMAANIYSPKIGGPMTYQSKDTTRVQFDEQMSFTTVTYRSVGEGLFTEAEMTQRQPQHKNLQHGSWLIIHSVLNPGAHGTACRWLNRLRSIFSR